MAFDGILKFGTAIDQSGFKSGLSGLGSIAKTGMSVVTGAVAGVTAAVGGAVAGVSSLSGMMLDAAGSAAVYGDNIDKMSQKLGMSAEAYQEWDFILQHNGTSIDSMTQGMKTLSNAVADQSKTATAAFDKLGISLEDAAKLSQEDLFAEVITKLQEMPAGAERTALANDLLGRSSMELGALLNSTAEDTEELRQQVHDLGGVMSDEAVKAAAAYQDALQNLQTAGDGLKRGLVSELLPSLTTMMDGMSAILSGDLSGTDVLVSGLDSLTGDLEGIFEHIGQVGEQMLPKLSQGIEKALPDVIKAGGSIFGTLLTSALRVLPVVLTTLSGVGGTLIDGIVTTLSDNSEDLISAGVTLLTMLANGLLSTAPLLLQAAADLITQLVATLAEPDGLDALLTAAIQIITTLATLLGENTEPLLTAAIQLIMQLVNTLADPASLTGLLDVVLTIITTLASLLGENLSPLLTAAITIVQTLGTYLGEHADTLVETALTLLLTIVNAIFDNTDLLLMAAEAIIGALWTSLLNADTLSKMFSLGFQILTAIMNGLLNFGGSILGFALDMFLKMVEVLMSMDWIQLGTDIVNTILDAFTSIDYGYLNEFKDTVINTIRMYFNESLPELLGIGADILAGIANGLITGDFSFIEDVKNRILGGLSDVFGIHSPSRVMRDQVGKYLAQGVGVGFVDEMPSVSEDALGAFNRLQSEVAADRYRTPQSTSYITNNYNTTNQTSTNSATPEGGGVRDIIVPVSIGGEHVETLVVHAVQAANAESGGVTL